MNTKTILAAIAGSIFLFLGGWLVFGVLLAGFYASNTIAYEGLMKMPMPDLLFIFLSGLAMSILITFIYSKWANIKTFGAGFTNGLIIYFLYACAYDLNVYGFMNLQSLTLTFTDIIAQTIFGGMVGGIIGFVLGMGKKS